MPPRKRAKKAVAVEKNPDPSPQYDSTSKIRPDVAQTSKIFDLPIEIFVEVLSYFPALPIPTTSTAYPLLSPETLARSDALRALSQTCLSFRNIFFPLLWERLEACAVRTRIKGASRSDNREEDGNQVSGAWYLAISKAVLTKCNGILANPGYATHVT